MRAGNKNKRSVVLCNAHTPTVWYSILNQPYSNIYSFRSLFSGWVKNGELPSVLGGGKIITKKFKGKRFYEIVPTPMNGSSSTVELDAEKHLTWKELYAKINGSHYANTDSFKSALLALRNQANTDLIEVCGYEVRILNIEGVVFYEIQKFLYS